VPLVDHLVVAGSRYVSLAERGVVPEQLGEAPVWTA